MNYFEMEPERVWQFATSWTKEKKKEKLAEAIMSDLYLGSEKKDGHWHRFVLQNGVSKIQTRGVSTLTNTYGEHQDHVPHIYNFLKDKCEKDTVLLGEMYLKGKKDRDVTSILGCLPKKAIDRQEKQKVIFYIFDVLVWNGIDLSKTMFEDRVELLRNEVTPFVADNAYIEVAEFFEGDEIYNKLELILESGGEGIVMVKKNSFPEPKVRTAHKTIKIKAELNDDIDAFFTGSFMPGARTYKGSEIRVWEYWQDLKSSEFLKGRYFNEYVDGQAYEPVTKNYFYNRPGSLEVGVYKADGSVFSLGYVSGLTDELKDQFAKDKQSVINKPVLISAMEFTEDRQLRHPRFKGFKKQGVLEDCTYDKIFGEE